jgi:hypothetical protein
MALKALLFFLVMRVHLVTRTSIVTIYSAKENTLTYKLNSIVSTILKSGE